MLGIIARDGSRITEECDRIDAKSSRRLLKRPVGVAQPRRRYGSTRGFPWNNGELARGTIILGKRLVRFSWNTNGTRRSRLRNDETQ